MSKPRQSVLIAGVLLFGVALASATHAADQRGKITIDAGKREGTINLNKTGTWKAGLSDLPKSPSPSEAQRRLEQQQQGGTAFIRKTF